MAEAAVDFLLNNLKNLLIYNAHLITNAKNEIESLEMDLRLIKGFLKELVKKRIHNEETKALVQIIRDVVYEVEDIIDAFITQSIEKKAKGILGGFWNSAPQLNNIGQKVQDVKARVQEAIDALANHKVEEEPKSDESKYQVWTIRMENIVGFEDVTNRLIQRLTEETSDLDIVSLTGMFGLGKTTLAWKIYSDPRIKFKFPYRKWLTVSQDFSEREIFMSILKDFTFTARDMSSSMDHELAHMVKVHLEQCTFLIVMDDVWSCDDWVRLETALPKDSSKGKVLVTSRDVEVGNRASHPSEPEALRYLKLEESLELLRLEALGKQDFPDELLKSVGKRIASDCKGLPLSVVVIGGILARKCSSDTEKMKRDWENIATRVNEYLINDDAEHMKNFISLSYNRLPYHLRSCFLYFAMFPEDCEIPVSKLIHMWIAEAFIQQNDSCSLEETAEMYLADLIKRNLVLVKSFKADGKVKSCGIHDAIRNFCRAEAGNEYEKFLQEIEFVNGVFQPSPDELQKYRRLTIHSNYFGFVSSNPYFGPRVRSFVCSPKEDEECVLEAGMISDILVAFKLLRVLDIKPITFTKFTRDIYQLVHVRYMVFSFNLSVLPAKFSDLWNMQTLVVETTSRKLDVRADIWNMKHLRHFKTNASATLPKPNKHSKHGAELQTLGTISVESCTPRILEQAYNLKKLGIRGRLALLVDGKNGFFDSMGQMKCLEKLKLINDLNGKPASEGKLHSLPPAYQFPSTLKSLTLVATSLSWNSMSVLGLLENLIVLKLKKNAFLGNTWILEGGDPGFRCLEVLKIEDTNFRVWLASPHHFPALKRLVLKKCENLLGIPIGLAEVPNFQMLELYACEKAAASAKQIVEAKKEKLWKGSVFKHSIFPPIE